MLRALATLLGLAALTAWGAEFRPLNRSSCRSDGRSRMCMDPGNGGSAGGVPLLRFLPSDGSGVPTFNPNALCDFPAELVGSYICMRGDGTSVLGAGVTLTKTGSVTTTTPRVCPNGPNCSAITVQSYNGVGGWSGNQTAAPAGDFSLCAVVRQRNATASQLSLTLGGIGGSSVNLNFQPSGVTALYVAAVPVFLSGSLFHGMWSLACGTYRRVGIGTSVASAYRGGTSSIKTDMPLPTAGSFPAAFSTQSVDNADVAAWLYTEKELGAATIASMDAAIYGAPMIASDGSAVGYSASLRYCPVPDGSLVALRNDLPCITTPPGFAGPAIGLQGVRTNMLIWSQGLDAWTPSAATVTANNTTGPDQTIDAERINADATTAEHMVTRTPTLTAGTAHAVSVFGKAGTQPVIFLKYGSSRYAFINTTTGATSVTGAGITATSEQFGTFWRLKAIVNAANSVANPTIGVGISTTLGTSSYAGQTSDNAFAFGAQLEAGGLVSWYIRADATPVARGPHATTLTRPAGLTDVAGCGAARLLVDGFEASTIQRVLGVGVGADYILGLNAANSVGCQDSTTGVHAVGADFTAAAGMASCGWSAAIKEARNGAVLASGAYDGTILGVVSVVSLGANAGTSDPLFGWLGDVRLGGTPNACN